MIKTAPSALKKHFDNDIKNVKHTVMQKLVDEKKISQSVYDTLKKQKMKYNKGKKVAPKPSVKKKVKIDFDDLYAGGASKSGEYINDMADETSFAKARAKVRKLLVVYNKTASPTIAGAYAYLKEQKA